LKGTNALMTPDEFNKSLRYQVHSSAPLESQKNASLISSPDQLAGEDFCDDNDDVFFKEDVTSKDDFDLVFVSQTPTDLPEQSILGDIMPKLANGMRDVDQHEQVLGNANSIRGPNRSFASKLRRSVLEASSVGGVESPVAISQGTSDSTLGLLQAGGSASLHQRLPGMRLPTCITTSAAAGIRQSFGTVTNNGNVAGSPQDTIIRSRHPTSTAVEQRELGQKQPRRRILESSSGSTGSSHYASNFTGFSSHFGQEMNEPCRPLESDADIYDDDSDAENVPRPGYADVKRNYRRGSRESLSPLKESNYFRRKVSDAGEVKSSDATPQGSGEQLRSRTGKKKFTRLKIKEKVSMGFNRAKDLAVLNIETGLANPFENEPKQIFALTSLEEPS